MGGAAMVATGTPDRCTAGTCKRLEPRWYQHRQADEKTGTTNQVF
ncbi:hypothetical protein [Chitinophaga qingshengii]|nr:hypothetical protein [Chitinophaga qingshengii]